MGAIALFKKKSLAISKLGGMGSHKKKFELKKIKEEKEKQLEVFRQKRETIKKEKEKKRKMSMKVNKIQLELFIGEPETKPPIKDEDELSVSSGDGEVFTHNLMGFWT